MHAIDQPYSDNLRLVLLFSFVILRTYCLKVLVGALD